MTAAFALGKCENRAVEPHLPKPKPNSGSGSRAASAVGPAQGPSRRVCLQSIRRLDWGRGRHALARRRMGLHAHDSLGPVVDPERFSRRPSLITEGRAAARGPKSRSPDFGREYVKWYLTLLPAMAASWTFRFEAANTKLVRAHRHPPFEATLPPALP